jgi:hypothetical protein
VPLVNQNLPPNVERLLALLPALLRSPARSMTQDPMGGLGPQGMAGGVGLVANPEHWGFQLVKKYFPKLAAAAEKNPRVNITFRDWADFIKRSPPGLDPEAYGAAGYANKAGQTSGLPYSVYDRASATRSMGTPTPIDMGFNPKKVSLETMPHEFGHAFSYPAGKPSPTGGTGWSLKPFDLPDTSPGADPDLLRRLEFIKKQLGNIGLGTTEDWLKRYRGDVPHLTLEAAARRAVGRQYPMYPPKMAIRHAFNEPLLPKE